MEQDSSRYRDIVAALARACLTRAADAPVLSQAAGWPVSIGAVAAGVLLGARAEPSALDAGLAILTEAARRHAPARFNDTFGFSRPVYHPLLIHLHQRAAHLAGRPIPFPQLLPGATQMQSDDVSLTLWWALCRYQRGDTGDIEAVHAIVQTIVDRPGPDGSLHRRRDEDQLDAWTYRELSGLHALARLALVEGNAHWQQRVREIARHHQAVTQPDYTTYQPWAVFAFLTCPGTVLFGEQQLHDTETNLHVETPGAGLLAGLLLADAADAMALPGQAPRAAAS